MLTESPALAEIDNSVFEVITSPRILLSSAMHLASVMKKREFRYVAWLIYPQPGSGAVLDQVKGAGHYTPSGLEALKACASTRYIPGRNKKFEKSVQRDCVWLHSTSYHLVHSLGRMREVLSARLGKAIQICVQGENIRQ